MILLIVGNDRNFLYWPTVPRKLDLYIQALKVLLLLEIIMILYWLVGDDVALMMILVIMVIMMMMEMIDPILCQ